MDHVVLVNEQDEELGVMEKMEAHQKAVLHRAFSVFIFNEKKDMLLQQRALSKYHSPSLWTNACCSHPKPGESVESAAVRRLQEELGFTTTLKPIFSFIYKASFDNGLTEHEFDHVLIGEYNGNLFPNPSEVMSTRYVPVEQIETQLTEEPANYTAWFTIAFPKVVEWLKNNHR